MKANLVILVLLVLSFNSKASAPINLFCMTETPTTSFVASTNEENLTIRLVHHNGVKYMPIHSGVITPNDLGTLSDRADVLAYLGEDLSFEIPLSSCEVQDDYLFNCFKSMPAKIINGRKVAIWAVNTSRSINSSFAGEYRYIETSISIDVDGQSLHMPMKYFENECSPNFNKEKIKLLK